MTRQSWMGRMIRVAVLLVIPGAAVMATGTSCGDQMRQTMTDAGMQFVGDMTTQLLEAVVGDLLGQGQTQS